MSIQGLIHRPLITTKSDKIFHDGDLCRVVMRREKICVGCTDITPQALEWLLKKYQELFPKQDTAVIVQEGE